MPTSPSKDTIYIDPEDEITGIIEKVRSSEAKIVALVLPKRATTMQSIVNLKLLKRMAKEAKKSLVLITSDPNLLPIAGAVGLHVAKTLQSKPEIPKTPEPSTRQETIDEPEAVKPVNTGDPTMVDKSKTIGELAGVAAVEDTIDLDNENKAPSILKEGSKAAAAKNSLKKKLKIPDFDRFRLLLFTGAGLLILLIVGGIFAFIILPKARITIKTDSANVSSDLNITAKTDAKELDAEKLITPAIRKELKKTENEKVPTTGQRNDGTKAKGTLTLTNCINDAAPHTVPAGTGFSSGQFTFITDTAVTLEPALYSGSNCKSSTYGLSKSVGVTAAQVGDNYNLGARSYTSPASLNTSNGSIQATGSDMTGGTTKIVKVVAQADIDNAKQKILDRLNTAATTELKTQFEAENDVALADTYAGTNPTTASTPNLNDEATEVTVNVSINYSQLGIKKDHLKTLIEINVKKQIDNSKQTIKDNGLDKAVIRLVDKLSPNEVKFTVQSIAIAGPQLDSDGIKREIRGKKKGETVKIIQSRPGIKDVEINYSPFWVFSTPKSAKKITITFDQNNVSP